MSRFFFLSAIFTATFLFIGCASTPPESPTGARPEIIFDDIGGVWQPARGIERNSRPTIPDGQRYRASGPFPVKMKDIPVAERGNPSLQGLEHRRGGGRMESPLPDEVMDKLRNDARYLRANPHIQDVSPDAVSASSQAATVSGVSFPSIDYDECCGGGGNVPPDPELAAGTGHLIAVVNVAFEIYDTSGNSVDGGPKTFASFFSGVPGCTGVFDPNVNYDEAKDRFILAIDGDGSDYCIAVSETGDPTGNWYRYSFQTASRRDFFDYPHAGVGDDAIYMGANIFGPRSFKEGRIWAIHKLDMYAGNAPQVVSFGIGNDGTPQPMNLHGFNQGSWPAGEAHYILTDGQSFDGRNYGVWSWSNPFGGGNPIKRGEVNLNAATGDTAGMPIDAPQQGGGDLQANDWRGQDAEYRDGYIWMSNAQSCNPGDGTVNCVRWAQIDPVGPNGPIVIDADVIGGNGEYRSFPDLAVDSCGNMMMGYSKTSTSSNPGVYATGLEKGSLLYEPEIEVRAGEAVYDAFDGSPHRWGDYTEMTIAPDGSTFWYLGEYSKDISNTSGNWGTWISSFSFGCNGGGNPPPVAVIDTPPDCTLLDCEFVGSNSTADAGIASYDWDFGDGNSSTQADPLYTYGEEGTYNVSLTVADNDGGSDTDSYSLTVDDGINSAPNAVITSIVCPDRTCDFDGRGSTDSDGSISNYAWDFGDGANGTGATTSHLYADYGDYTARLVVTDNEDEPSTNDASATVPLSEPVDPQTFSIGSILLDTLNRGGGNKSPRATVSIVDDQGGAVSSVTVTGNFNLDGNDTSDTDTTGGNGTVTLISDDSKKGRVKFTFCVTAVSHSGNLPFEGSLPACTSN